MGVSELQKTDLLDLAKLATELGAEHIASSLRAIAERIADGRFYVACVGQFKRGKSTLLNALVGGAILPAGVVPVTSVPTILRFGEIPSARLRLPDSHWIDIPIDEIEQFVSEEKNPENIKGIAALEIFVPCQFLSSGMCLVDTPGLGSVFTGNTKATLEFVPHMDAILIVIGADPPISGEELDLVENVARDVHEMLFVLNKADRVIQAECFAASAFARRVIEKRLQRTIPEIFEVSALERLEGRGPERDWPKLERTLERLVRCSGRTLVQEALDRAVRRTSTQLLAVIEENRTALREPLEESERRIDELRQTVERVNEATRDLGALLVVEQEHLSRVLGEQRKMFLDRTLGPAREELNNRLSSLPRERSGVSYRRKAMRAAQEIAHSKVVPWLEAEERKSEEMFQHATRRFIELGNDFLRRMGDIGLPISAFQVEADLDRNLRSKPHFRFHTIERIAAPSSPVVFFVDLIQGFLGIRAAIDRDAEEFLDQLLEVNSARVQRVVDDQIRESRKNLEAEIQAILREVESVADHALHRARLAQTAGNQAVRELLTRFDTAELEIHRIDCRRESNKE